MSLLAYLEPGEPFPSTDLALDEPNGLLAAGGLLDTVTLLAAYERGIFPWFEPPQPVLWWSPDPRSVLRPDEIHLSRSLRKALRKNPFELRVDSEFEAVVTACAAPRDGQRGTWISDQMMQAYAELHSAGFAHSVEVYNQREVLVGGLYGVRLGGVFFGESMFARQADASKAAFTALAWNLINMGATLIDCQIESEHLNSLGAVAIPRVDFEERLAQTVPMSVDESLWRAPISCSAMLEDLLPLLRNGQSPPSDASAPSGTGSVSA
ncbi:MAG: leucyl/phenylalanyl-tRNA--protein transferase [Pseudomonadota bacterium]